jgi:hypothetical protein
VIDADFRARVPWPTEAGTELVAALERECYPPAVGLSEADMRAMLHDHRCVVRWEAEDERAEALLAALRDEAHDLAAMEREREQR